MDWIILTCTAGGIVIISIHFKRFEVRIGIEVYGVTLEEVASRL